MVKACPASLTINNALLSKDKISVWPAVDLPFKLLKIAFDKSVFTPKTFIGDPEVVFPVVNKFMPSKNTGIVFILPFASVKYSVIFIAA